MLKANPDWSASSSEGNGLACGWGNEKNLATATLSGGVASFEFDYDTDSFDTTATAIRFGVNMGQWSGEGKAKFSDVILLEKGAASPSDGSVILSSSKHLEKHGYINFTDLDGCPEDFDITNYKSVAITLLQYTKAGELIKSKPQESKFTVNYTGAGSLFNGGYGNGYDYKFVHNVTPDPDTGEISFTLTEFTSGENKADCFSYQFLSEGTKDKGDGYIILKEAKFTPKD